MKFSAFFSYFRSFLGRKKYISQKELFSSIGDTPIIEYRRYKNSKIFIKCEFYNGFGNSVKSRTALSAIRHLEKQGINKEKNILLTASSGNFGTSFSALGRYLGYQVAVVVGWNVTKANEDYMKFLGAEVIKDPSIITTGQGNDYCKKLAKEDDRYIFFNQSVSDVCPTLHYNTTAREILRDMPNVQAVITSMGSGSTLFGISTFMRDHAPWVRMFHSVAENQDVTVVGTHKNGVDFETPFITQVKEKNLSESFATNNDQALHYMQKMNARGISGGLQGGGVLHVAHQVIDKYDLRGPVVVVCGDGVLKNLDKVV